MVRIIVLPHRLRLRLDGTLPAGKEQACDFWTSLVVVHQRLSHAGADADGPAKWANAASKPLTREEPS